MIVELDRNLAHYADVIKASLQVDVKSIHGAGAAGGMGAALMAFQCGAAQRVEIVTEALKLEEQIHDCSLVVTGKGGSIASLFTVGAGGGGSGGEEIP